MAPKRQAKSSVESPHDEMSFEEAILQRIEGKFDTEALKADLMDQVATKLAASIRMEDLVELFVEQKCTELSTNLAERILASVLRG